MTKYVVTTPDDILNVLSFLYWRRQHAGPHDMWGGVKIEQAYQSFLDIVKISEQQAELIFNYEGINGTEE